MRNGRTIFGVVSSDALADVWQTTILDHQITRRLVTRQLDKFGRVMSVKYERRPESFEASVKHPHQFRAVLTVADFRASGEAFPNAELLDAVESSLDDSSRNG
jgi:hypothetical protein